MAMQLNWQGAFLVSLEFWIWFSGLHRPDMAVHVCNPHTWEMEMGGSEIQRHPPLYSEFQASLNYTKPYFKYTHNI